MTKYIPFSILFTLALLMAGCHSNPQPNSNAQNQPAGASSLPLKNLIIEPFREVDSSEYVVIPLAFTDARGKSKGFASSGYDSPAGSYWNLIFYNVTNGEYHLLSENLKMHIGTWTDLNPNYIVYRIITEDYNKDGLLDDRDPGYLFTTDKNGYNLKQITPSGFDAERWEKLANKNLLIVSLSADVNGDKKFGHKEGAQMYKVDLDTPTNSTFMIDPAFIKKAQTLFIKQWPELLEEK